MFIRGLTVLLIIAFVPASIAALVSATQKTTQDTYVIVHGAWGGGWAWREIDGLLTKQGHKVYRPTLTGLGERSHLASADIGLETHILDVLNVLLYEELDNVVLVGHSYGGMVVAGVIDRVPDRIKRVVYLEALLPENGESVSTLPGTPIDMKKIKRWLRDDLLIPAWLDVKHAPPWDSPHPVKTFTDPVYLVDPEIFILSLNSNFKFWFAKRTGLAIS